MNNDGFDELRKKVSEYQKRPLTIAQRCSALEAGFAPEELGNATQEFCKRFEDSIFKRKPTDPATLKQITRLLTFYNTDLAFVDTSTFDAETWTFDSARKQLSYVLRNPAHRFYDEAYAEETRKRFNRKDGL